VLPGGRAAEQLVFDEPSTGASGSVAYDRDRSPFLPPNFPMPQERNYGEDTAQAVDAAVRTLVGAALQRVFAVLDRNRALLDRTSAALLATETLDEAEIEQLTRQIVGEGRESVPAAEIVA
jgi:cell division protease FtsH